MMCQNLSNDYGEKLQNIRSEYDNKLESIISQFLENETHQANEIKRLNDQIQSLKDTIN
jgi:polyhydroxyalkanoate synthesis regulator phasin